MGASLSVGLKGPKVWERGEDDSLAIGKEQWITPVFLPSSAQGEWWARSHTCHPALPAVQPVHGRATSPRSRLTAASWQKRHLREQHSDCECSGNHGQCRTLGSGSHSAECPCGERQEELVGLGKLWSSLCSCCECPMRKEESLGTRQQG